MNEAAIKEYPGYKATTNGEIIGKHNKPMIGRTNRDGYREVILSYYPNFQKSLLVHRLILSTFAPIENMQQYNVRHKNGNRLDNRLENLEWCKTNDLSMKKQNEKRFIIPYVLKDDETEATALKAGCIEHEGRIYKKTMYYADKYAINQKWLVDAKNNGLPHILIGHSAFVNEDDFHDYCAGVIGGNRHGY